MLNPQWRVGDHCSAHFSEDNLVYNAIIKSLNYKLGTCWITYVGYGNEEEKDLDELMAPVQDRLSQEEDSYYSEVCLHIFYLQYVLFVQFTSYQFGFHFRY